MRVLLTGVRTSLARHLARYLLSNGHDVAMVARKPFEVEKPQIGTSDIQLMLNEADDYSSGEDEDMEESRYYEEEEYFQESGDSAYVEHSDEMSVKQDNHDNAKLKVYEWDLARGYIDEKALKDVDAIVHLTCCKLFGGSSLKGDAKILSTELLLRTLLKHQENMHLKVFVFASSMSYYGDREETVENVHEEQEKCGAGEVSKSCSEWEDCARKFEVELSVRTVILRVGAVLCESNGVLMRLCDVMSWHLGCCLGNGRHWVPWIHIEDVIRMCLFVIEKESCTGVFNCVIPHQYQIRYSEFLQLLANKLQCYYWLPNIPKLLVETVLEVDVASFMLYQARVAASKITTSGFSFKHTNLSRALDLLLEDFLYQLRKQRSQRNCRCISC